MTENTIATTETAYTQDITPKFILEQITKIASDTAHITEALNSLKDVQSIGPGDIGAEEKAKGIADVVRCRETTNQQLLAFYTKLYNDLTAPKKDPMIEKIELVRAVRLSTLQELKECYCEDELVERADSILADISGFCNGILLDNH